MKPRTSRAARVQKLESDEQRRAMNRNEMLMAMDYFDDGLSMMAMVMVMVMVMMMDASCGDGCCNGGWIFFYTPMTEIIRP